jgi:ferritin-like metal-binding protein YciE
MKKRTDSGTRRSHTDSRSKQTDSAAEEMMNNPLHEVFLEEIADVYSAEQQLIKALPKMANAAQSEDLREAFESHLEETQEQSRRLEEAIEALDATMKRKKCMAMEGLIKEADEMMSEHKGQTSIDAVLIAAAQKVEHYEIASYGTLLAWARRMGHDEAADLFEQSLDEEKAADETLTEIAESHANEEAEAQD